ncbi:DUF2637 domain-containing protein [Brevibacterium sp. FAM 24638]|uniref:DUF2637 domain-containing protein n=1 Tax=Brevibacterium sp. FAM 24638 TaxID=3415681 RepID=UPI003C79831C
MRDETTNMQRRGRLDADARPVAWTLAGLLAVTAVAAMALSFQAHTQVAAERLGAGRLAAAYPVAVDGALVGLAVAMLVQARRGESRMLSSLCLLFFTLLSSTVNVVHVIDLPAPVTLPYIGAVFGALLPVMVLGLTEVLCRVVFSPAQATESVTIQDTAEPIAVQDTDAADQTIEPAPEPQLESPPALRPATQAVPGLRSTPKPRRRFAPTSAVPDDRIDEVNEAIDRLLVEGLSRQAVADRLTDELQIPISKSRVSRRAAQHQEAAA